MDLLIPIATFCCGLMIGSILTKWIYRTDCDHTWGIWDEPEKISSSNSFHTTTTLIQKRACRKCGECQTKQLHTVYSS